MWREREQTASDAGRVKTLSHCALCYEPDVSGRPESRGGSDGRDSIGLALWRIWGGGRFPRRDLAARVRQPVLSQSSVAVHNRAAFLAVPSQRIAASGMETSLFTRRNIRCYFAYVHFLGMV